MFASASLSEAKLNEPNFQTFKNLHLPIVELNTIEYYVLAIHDKSKDIYR